MGRALPPPAKRGLPGLTQLGPPNPRFDPRRSPEFESLADVTQEDAFRAARLRRLASHAPRAQALELCRLADRIDPLITPNPTTPASSRYMRRLRIRIVGAIWEVVYLAACRGIPCATATLVWEGCSIPLGELDQFDPVKFLERFRQHIYRSAKRLGVPVTGQLFAALHGAYDPATQSYPMHVHVIAIGGMIPIVDGLRKLRVYRPAQAFDGRDAANTPVRMSSGPLTNMPDPLTYVPKKYWPQRETYMDVDGLRKAYRGKHKRIPEPAHTEVLRFFDKHRLEDVTMMMGMCVRNGRLVLL